MENKNSSKVDFCNERIAFPLVHRNLNLLNQYNIIHFNGQKFPRLPIYNPFLIKSFQLPFGLSDVTSLIKSNNIKRKNEICESMKEKEFKNLFEQNKPSILTKNNNSNDYIKNIENKNIFNFFLNNDKNYNYIQYKNQENIKKSRDKDKKLINNNFEKEDSNNIMQNKINIINNNIYDIKVPNLFFCNSFPTLNNHQKLNLKTIENINIDKDQSPSIFSNSSKSNIQNKSKNLFIVNEILNQEKNKEENEVENKIQPTLLTNKRGRKQINHNNKKIHSALDDDNILRKIQVHYISFITNFINDIIRVFIKTRNVPLFKNVDYKLKKIVNHEYFLKLKSLKIADILQMTPSPKMKNHDISVNKNIYTKVCNLFPFMINFLQINFINFFKEYYFNNSKNYTVNGKIIPLSEKTKNFNDLINKNYAYKEKIKFIALNCFLDDEKAMDKLKFKTEY